MFNVQCFFSFICKQSDSMQYSYSSVCKSNSQFLNWKIEWIFTCELRNSNSTTCRTLNIERRNKVEFRIFDRNVTKLKAWNENMTHYVMHPLSNTWFCWIIRCIRKGKKGIQSNWNASRKGNSMLLSCVFIENDNMLILN